jgi:hypothetical protein
LQPAQRTWIRQQIAANILREVRLGCGAAGLPFLPVKGAVTARLLYEDIAERPVTDVDVRIRMRDFSRFRRMARDLGWRCVRVARVYGNLVYSFPGLSLDVEAMVGPPGLCALTVDTMLARATRFELAPGLTLDVPEIHDHAVVLVINAFKDKMIGAAVHAIDDLDRIARLPAFDAGAFVRRAIEVRIATIAWMVAEWREGHGSEPWGLVRSGLERDARLRRSYAGAVRGLLASADHGSMAVRLLMRAGADTRLMQAGALFGAAAWEAEMWLRGQRRTDHEG